MKKESSKEYLGRDEVNEMIESALRRHNRRSRSKENERCLGSNV